MNTKNIVESVIKNLYRVWPHIIEHNGNINEELLIAIKKNGAVFLFNTTPENMENAKRMSLKIFTIREFFKI